MIEKTNHGTRTEPCLRARCPGIEPGTTHRCDPTAEVCTVIQLADPDDDTGTEPARPPLRFPLDTQTTGRRQLPEPDQPILLAAQQELERRHREADAAGDWRTRWLLSELIDVADYTRRVALPTATSHYRAEKSGALAAAVERVQKVVFVGLAGWPEPDDDYVAMHPTEQAINDAFEILEAVRRSIRTGAWVTASDSQLYRSDADAMTRAAATFTKWANQMATNAVPDPVD